jgi:hypothetical protein
VLEELPVVALPLNANRPVMADADVDLSANLKRLPDVQLPNMVDTVYIILAVR